MMTVEDLQAEIETETAREIADHLDCAESCETIEDFQDNIQNAIDAAKTLIYELKKLQVEFK